MEIGTFLKATPVYKEVDSEQPEIYGMVTKINENTIVLFSKGQTYLVRKADITDETNELDI